MERLPTLKDEDSTWALKSDEPKEDSDDAASSKAPKSVNASQHSLPQENSVPPPPPQKSVARERKHSLPLSARMFVLESSSPGNPFVAAAESIDHAPAKKIKLLTQISNSFVNTDPSSIAQQLSKFECKFFMQIKVSLTLATFKNHVIDSLLASALAKACSRQREQGS